MVINTNDEKWVQSPRKGVWRKRLAREEAERGHATSIVKYEAGASFSQHDHPLGTYFRNPEGYIHEPFSKAGCIILVKLHQFAENDDKHVSIKTEAAQWQQGHGNLKVLPLHQFESESVALVHWPAGEKFTSHQHFGGEEIYVISGEFIDEYGRYPAGTWIRSPHHPYVEQDTLIWVKVGHLNNDGLSKSESQDYHEV